MSSKERDLRFSMESMKYLEKVKNDAWESVRSEAIEKVTRENRNVVTVEDVRSCIHDALSKLAANASDVAKVGG